MQHCFILNNIIYPNIYIPELTLGLDLFALDIYVSKYIGKNTIEKIHYL